MILPMEKELDISSTKVNFGDLKDTKVGDRGASFIAWNLPNLVNLAISDSNLTDKGAKVIAELLSQLKSLQIGKNKISD